MLYIHAVPPMPPHRPIGLPLDALPLGRRWRLQCRRRRRVGVHGLDPLRLLSGIITNLALPTGLYGVHLVAFRSQRRESQIERLLLPALLRWRPVIKSSWHSGCVYCHHHYVPRVAGEPVAQVCEYGVYMPRWKVE